MTIALKRRRPRIWDDAQVIAWIVHRTERAVNDAEGMLKAIQAGGAVLGARGGKPRKASLAFQLAMLFERDNYFADGSPTAGRVARRYAKTEKEFEAAIAKGRLERKGKDHSCRAKEVKAIWPSSGSGNSEKLFFDRELVNRVAAVIACNGQTRRDVIRELGPRFSKKAKQSALLRAATHAAIRYLKSGEPPSIEPPSVEWGHPPESALVTPSVEGEHPLVTTPREAKELSTRRDVPERDRKSLAHLARMKQLSPSERKAQIQYVKAFEKRTLRGPITASN